jgi:hypothetical protein
MLHHDPRLFTVANVDGERNKRKAGERDVRGKAQGDLERCGVADVRVRNPEEYAGVDYGASRESDRTHSRCTHKTAPTRSDQQPADLPSSQERCPGSFISAPQRSRRAVLTCRTATRSSARAPGSSGSATSRERLHDIHRLENTYCTRSRASPAVAARSVPRHSTRVRTRATR